MSENEYLSYGAGVGSTALLCELSERIRDGEIEAVYLNHGGDLPETREYVRYVQRKLHVPITILDVDIEGKGGLYEWLWHYCMIPIFHYRICTVKAKVRPYGKYIKKPCLSYLGITYDERKRRVVNRDPGIENIYPLVNLGVAREEAVRIIKERGLSVPHRSSCFFCPFQSRGQWRELYMHHPELFEKAVALEDRAIEKKPSARLLPTGQRLKELYTEFEHQTTLEQYIEKEVINI